MKKPTDEKRSRYKTWARAICICAFLCIWLSGMTAAQMAGACRNDQYEGARKLRFCNISLIAGFWIRVSPTERAEVSIIQSERGVALSQLGQEEDAAEAFERALRDARAKPGSSEQRLHQRMIQLDDRRTHALWVSVVESADL